MAEVRVSKELQIILDKFNELVDENVEFKWDEGDRQEEADKLFADMDEIGLSDEERKVTELQISQWVRKPSRRREQKQESQTNDSSSSTSGLFNSVRNTFFGGGGGAKTKYKCDAVLPEQLSSTGFESLAGLVSELEAIDTNVILPILQPEYFEDGASNVLMYGPPGTGKTEIAKAIATEINRRMDAEYKTSPVHLFKASGANLEGKYVGDTSKFVEQLWECAEAKSLETEKANGRNSQALSIIFMDEIETLAGDRSKSGGDNPSNKTTTALLQAMQGVKAYPHIVVLGATNVPQRLDSAIESRFPTRIFVDLPSDAARKTIIENKLKGKYDERKVDLDRVVKDIVAATGTGPSGVQALAAIWQEDEDDNNADDEAIAWLAGRGRAVYKEDARSAFGYSARDLVKMLNSLNNQMATDFLQTQRDYKDQEPKPCAFQPRRGEEHRKCKPGLPRGGKKYMLPFPTRKQIDAALAANRSTIRASEYVELVRYSLQQ